MKSLKMFLESRTSNEMKVICKLTKKPCNVLYYAYDKDSLDLLEQKIKDDQYEEQNIYIAKQEGNKWIAYTNNIYNLNAGRKFDKYLCSDTIDYSYDDIVMLLEDGDIMLVVI